MGFWIFLYWNGMKRLRRYHAMHHPFTSPKPEDMHLIDTEPGKVRANAYDLAMNGRRIRRRLNPDS